MRAPASLSGYTLEAGDPLTPVRGVPPAGSESGDAAALHDGGLLRPNACPLARGQRRKAPAELNTVMKKAGPVPRAARLPALAAGPR